MGGGAGADADPAGLEGTERLEIGVVIPRMREELDAVAQVARPELAEEDDGVVVGDDVTGLELGLAQAGHVRRPEPADGEAEAILVRDPRAGLRTEVRQDAVAGDSLHIGNDGEEGSEGGEGGAQIDGGSVAVEEGEGGEASGGKAKGETPPPGSGDEDGEAGEGGEGEGVEAKARGEEANDSGAEEGGQEQIGEEEAEGALADVGEDGAGGRGPVVHHAGEGTRSAEEGGGAGDLLGEDGALEFMAEQADASGPEGVAGAQGVLDGGGGAEPDEGEEAQGEPEGEALEREPFLTSSEHEAHE